jgi:hypothetical protein
MKIIVAVIAVLLLGGCVTPPQAPVTLRTEVLDAKNGRIGVVMAPLPTPDTQFPGAGCLLCIAAANATHTTLTGYTQTLSNTDLVNLKNDVAALIRKKGGEVTVIKEELKVEDLSDTATPGPNVSRKDHTPLKKRYDVDKLVVLNIALIGIERPYSAYVPTGDPKGVLVGQGYLVNLSNNTLEWHQNVRVVRAAEGKWDEPPGFPGLTNAYFQALESGMDELKNPFGR